MTRLKVFIAVFGTSALLAIVVACIIVVCLRVAEQRDQGLKIIEEALERQKIKINRNFLFVLAMNPHNFPQLQPAEVLE